MANPFPCPDCNKSFSSTSTLNRHRKIKHGYVTRNPRLSDSERVMAQRNRNSRQRFQREFIKDRSRYIQIAMQEIISNRLTDLLLSRKPCVCDILKKNSTQNSIENEIDGNQRISESYYIAINLLVENVTSISFGRLQKQIDRVKIWNLMSEGDIRESDLEDIETEFDFDS